MARRSARSRDGERSSLVYSTRGGRVCRSCGRPLASCACRAAPRAPSGDGVVRIRREVKGRGGKTVTTVSGLPLSSEALRDLAGELRRRCGSGGTVRDHVVEIQGDHRDALVRALEERGYTVKLAGG